MSVKGTSGEFPSHFSGEPKGRVSRASDMSHAHSFTNADTSFGNQAQQRRKLQPATNPTSFTNLQEPGRNQTPRIEQPQQEQGFPNEHTEQSSQEVAPLAVVESSISDVVQQLPQVNTLENIDNLRYSELLRIFDATMQRWQPVICTPEYFLYHEPKSEHSNEVTKWGFDREYPSKTSHIVTYPKRREFDALQNDMVRINAFSTIEYGMHHLAFRASAHKNKAFIDPHNNEQLDRLTVTLTVEPIKAPYDVFIRDEDGEIIKDERGIFKTKIIENPVLYSVIIEAIHAQETGKDYGGLFRHDTKTRSLEFGVSNLSIEGLHIFVGKPLLGGIDVSDSDENLSVDHAVALFNLMNTLIPQSERRAIQPEDQPSE